MIPNRHNFSSKFFYSLLLIAIFIILPQNSQTDDYNLNYHPHSYVLKKLKTHNIVLLGTRHKQPAIINFISEIITALHNSGVTHIGLEITSNQQNKINNFLNTGTGLSEITLHQQIDCPEYRNLFKVLKELNSNERPNPIALDLPKSKYNESISRDEWLARSIAKIFRENPNAKLLIITGNNHVLKKLDWQDHVPNPHRSVREYLSEKRSSLRFFSIGQINVRFLRLLYQLAGPVFSGSFRPRSFKVC